MILHEETVSEIAFMCYNNNKRGFNIAYVLEIATAAVQNARGLSFLQTRIADEKFTIGMSSDECHGDNIYVQF